MFLQKEGLPKVIYFSVDQIGKNHAECEDNEGKVRCFRIKDVPNDIREGDILKYDKNGKIIKDEYNTDQMKEEIKTTLNKLSEYSP